MTVFARNPMKLELGRTFAHADQVVSVKEGMDPAHLKQAYSPEGRGFDVVIEAVGLPEIWEHSVSMVRRGGRVNLFAGCPGDSTVTLSTRRLHYDEIQINSLFHHTPHYVTLAFDWLTSGKLDPTPLITQSMSLEQLPEAFHAMENGQAVKVAIS